ncbi:hypothetical protein TspCOW1_31620 [Thiohalobacter sp. COW1]|uniref:Uncharacterized protein n=1 Tax=Thiohalobacter thiocyanaticus TaxID=585455 RepID=A0A1Z4VV01_9GAMM|nr:MULTISPECIES: hypothetical protein [Thiohalobacter]BAZ95024.1 uncharacterized protein FOKN1_2654 [Thiohalobacter thiocyanaticus]BCO33059.1 hypothetical protein TspCOW1_31620 [Thiohalobacter sp. COW1]
MKSARLKIMAWTGWLLVLLAGGLLAYHYLGRPAQPVLQLQPVELQLQQADCRADRGSCTAGAEGARINFELGPGVPVMRPFAIRATASLPAGEQPQQIEVDFRMVDMDMGRNRYRLMRDADHVWQGVATLPVCTMGRSDWQAVVEVESDSGRRYRAVFPFETE